MEICPCAQRDVLDGGICIDGQVVDESHVGQDTIDSGHHGTYSERDMDTQRDVLDGELLLSMTQ